MQRRIALSQQLFYAGLFLILGAGITSATIFPAGGLGLELLMLSGGIISLLSHIWQRRLRRSARETNNLVGLGGYPLDLLRDPRFISPRRATH